MREKSLKLATMPRMNKIIEEQLKKVGCADLSNFDPNTNTYRIKKRVDVKLEAGNTYLIKLDDKLLVSDLCPQLQYTFNGGRLPIDKYCKADVEKVVGGYMRVVCLGYDDERKADLTTVWQGWLPTSSVTVLERL